MILQSFVDFCHILAEDLRFTVFYVSLHMDLSFFISFLALLSAHGDIISSNSKLILRLSSQTSIQMLINVSFMDSLIHVALVPHLFLSESVASDWQHPYCFLPAWWNALTQQSQPRCRPLPHPFVSQRWLIATLSLLNPAQIFVWQQTILCHRITSRVSAGSWYDCSSSPLTHGLVFRVDISGSPFLAFLCVLEQKTVWRCFPMPKTKCGEFGRVGLVVLEVCGTGK